MKALPSNLEIEQYIIGCILDHKKSAYIAESIINSDMFYAEKNAYLYTVMVDMLHKEQAIDILTVSHAVSKAGKLEYIGGAYYLTQCTNSIASDAHIAEWCIILKQLFTEREVMKLGIDMHQKITSGESGQDVIQFAGQRLTEIQTLKTNSFTTATDIGRAIQNQLTQLHETKSIEAFGIRPSLAGFRRLVKYWKPQDLVIVAGRPAMGKTATTKRIILDYIYQGKMCLMYSLEMSKEALMNRFIYELLNTDKEIVTRTALESSPAEHIKLLQSIEQATDIFKSTTGGDLLLINDRPPANIEQLRAEVATLKATNPDLEAVIIDYLQLIPPTEHTLRQTTAAQVGHISRQLKLIAKELNITVFALSQLNRGLENRTNKEPNLADLRDSGAIEQDADMVLFLHRGEKYGEVEMLCNGMSYPAIGNMKIICAKFRDGATGEEIFRFVGSQTAVKDYENSGNVNYYEPEKLDLPF